MHEEIRVVIIDDEDIWLRSIAATLNDFGYTVAGTADNFEQAVSLIANQDYDIVLLDVNINGKNRGIELGKMLTSVYKKPFVFLTGSSDNHTLKEAIEAGPSAYLTKPVHPASLAATVQTAINNFTNKMEPAAAMATENNPFFFIKQGNKYKKIEWLNVVFLRSDKNYTIIYNGLDKMEYYVRSTLSRTLNMVIPASLRQNFVQVNRGEAVHTRYIQELANDEVHTTNHTFTVTESYTALLKKAITILT